MNVTRRGGLAHPQKFPIFRFGTIKSTQTTSKKIVNKLITTGLRLRNPMVITATAQTGGYGRFNRKWSSPDGGLWFSVIIDDDKLSYASVPNLVTRVARSVQKTVNTAYDIKTTVKLPNDLQYNGKKLAGCLTETINLHGRMFVIIGIGLNVNNKIPASLKNAAISLSLILNKKVDTDKLLKRIVNALF
jgi:BirA family biotin operon repressor/biotin-[acetyl-CoA-carboxylase] ligase